MSTGHCDVDNIDKTSCIDWTYLRTTEFSRQNNFCSLVIIILLIELKSSIDLITFLKVYEDEIL